MKALIFAAGRGERLKPLTDSIPKPLVKIKGKPLIQYHIEALRTAGIKEIVINVSWLKDQIIDFVTEYLAKANFVDLNIQFSVENEQPLETGGGMLKALSILGSKPFVVVNGDIYTDFNFRGLNNLTANQLVNLVLVKNPPHNQAGDFGLIDGQLTLKSKQNVSYTYAGIGLFNPQILKPPITEKVFSIVPYIKSAMTAQKALGQIHPGIWHDVGTLERLNELNQL